ncbi:MAG TPA: hypothetical protein VGL38_14670, partial [bacterium]
SMKRTVAVIAALAVIGLLLGGCASPEQRAQKLFDQGKYEEVLAKYPTTPVATQAKDKVAERLFNEGKYDDVVKTYGQTSFGPKAQTAMDDAAAKKMLDAKDFNGVLTRYPNSQAAAQARNALADQLYADKKNWDELINKYPNTPAAMKAKNELAKTQFDKIMKMHTKNTVKAKALSDFVGNPKFTGTQSVVDAQAEIARINAKAPAKKK